MPNPKVLVHIPIKEAGAFMERSEFAEVSVRGTYLRIKDQTVTFELSQTEPGFHKIDALLAAHSLGADNFQNFTHP